MRVAVIDVGKPGRNLGWAIDEPDEQGTDLDACIETLIVSLDKGPVALGFEAPQFVPIRHDPLALLAGRKGDFGRPFSAAAGATVLVTSLVIVPYVLGRLRKGLPHASASFVWRHPNPANCCYLKRLSLISVRIRLRAILKMPDWRLPTSGEG